MYKNFENEWSEYYFKLIDWFHKSSYLWFYLSKNQNITWDTIKNNDRTWDYDGVCFNPNMTWDILGKNCNDWYCVLSAIFWRKNRYRLCKHCYFSKSKSNYETICSHPNLTWKIIKNNAKTLNCSVFLSKNPNITWKMINDNPDIYWIWDFNC